MLLSVRNFVFQQAGHKIWIARTVSGAFLLSGLTAMALSTSSQVPGTTPQGATPQTPAAIQSSPAQTIPVANAAPVPQQPRPGLNIVVLDPAHGGTDSGARGTGGIRESEVVLEFATQVRRALELQGFQVVQTRQDNDNPSFDDRSAKANAQRGAIFISLHISSTGSPGTVRVYVNSELPSVTEANGLIPWDRAQAPFTSLSRKLGDQIQGLLAQTFKGSPNTAQSAWIRQLRTTAAPAVAVEISSVSVDNRADLDRMVPGVAEAIARGATAFKPSYVVAVSGQGAAQ
jgi:N-acetylmuramoyl-L-alanine amidase